MSFLSLSASLRLLMEVYAGYIVYAVFKVRCLAVLSAIRMHGPPCTRITDSILSLFLSWRPPALPRACAVPSASRGLTIVFGMGTGMSPGRIATRNT